MRTVIKKCAIITCAAVISMTLGACGWADDLYSLYAADHKTAQATDITRSAEYSFVVTFRDGTTQEEKEEVVEYIEGKKEEEKSDGRWVIKAGLKNTSSDKAIRILKEEFDCIEEISIPINLSGASN